MSIFTNLFKSTPEKSVKTFSGDLAKVNSLEESVSGLSDIEMKQKTAEYGDRIEKGETEEDILPEAYALVREAAKRVLGQRHFDVQIVGGIVLNGGNIAEMKTGEGKTQVATLPAYLNALSGKGVHIVTVNDYLSRRDAVWMGQIFSFLGLSVGVINHESSYLYDPEHKDMDEKRDEVGSYKIVYDFLRPCTRREAYEADITYGTNAQFGFDYLRDNLEHRAENLRQREFNYAIVDEVDSILIDEARTPLIISGQTSESENLYVKFAEVAKHLERDKHFEVDEKLKAVTLNDEGISKAEEILGIQNIYTEKGIKYVHHLETAVKAKAIFQKDKEYVVKDGQIVIVDEFTGRLQPGRRWSEGVHQAIEAKEGVSIQKESRTYASITYQNFFRLYKKLSGMTGTAMTSREEFFKVYGIETYEIPTNKPISRIDNNDLIFQTDIGKYKAIARKIKELNEKGQPVLIGTVSIEKNELLSQFLNKEGVKHELLNAKNHEREGEIIAQAGKKGGVTIATNMAGRGVDIKLGGVPFSKEKYNEIKELGGLFVMGTERHEARRIDNQLRGRSGRQGDEGETQFFVSLEDSLMRVFASDTIKSLMGRFNIPEDQPIENKMITKQLENAQTKIEGFHFDARKHVLQYDDVLNKQRLSVYERRRNYLLGSSEEIQAEVDTLLAEEPEILKSLQEKREKFGDDQFYAAIKSIFMQTIDMFWVDHLEQMEYTRSSVNLRAYGQRDPLVEYKKEALRMFREMNESVDEQIITMLKNASGEVQKRENIALREVHKNASSITNVNPGNVKASVVSKKPEVGRNDPCPCGSGKKFKKCGMLDTEEHKNNLSKK